MLIQESSEMYLETIYILSEKQTGVRSIDIAEYMGFSKPSVSRAIGILKEGGYITVEKNGFLKLTELGKARAQKVYERHEVLTNMFITLGVDEDTASEDACRIEHRISDASFEAIKKHFSGKWYFS